MSKKYFHSIAVMVGTIIGVGIFSLPFILVKTGLMIFLLYFFALAAVQYFIHLLYAEIILSTRQKHRLAGYAKRYLGAPYDKIVLILVLASVNLTILIYLIVGGDFAHKLLGDWLGGEAAYYSWLLFGIGLLITYWGFRGVAWTELGMSGLLLIVITIIVWKGAQSWRPEVLLYNNWQAAFLPYGPIFFALSGATCLPVICKLLAHKKENIKSVIGWGTFGAAALILIFSIVVAGVTGVNTSADALGGLEKVWGGAIMKIVLLFGFLAIFTSFIVSLQNSREIYWWDLGLPRHISWLLANFIPLGLWLLGFNNFAQIIGFTGALTGGMIGIVYILIARKVKQKREQPTPLVAPLNLPFAAILIALFLFVFGYEIWSLLN
ncbi:hypothetical protein D6821_00330 [Candidatus Parcubacteria bacterium]|nr:MAG: hypothetical protein D6821_00330 [Candidatus Parcubacteria bacterium]